MKIAIATDSGSGITQAQAKALGVTVVPMPFMINGEEFEEDITLNSVEFYKRMDEDADISTSQPAPSRITDIWDELLKEYDQILYVPMSSGLSSTCQTAKILEEDYDGKVQVVDNQRISVTQRQSVIDAKELADKGYDAAQIKTILEREKFESSIYITLDTLKYLKKGGRITPAAAALGTLLRLKPVLQIQGEKLDAFSKARTIKQGKATMLAALEHDLTNRFHDPEAEHMYLCVAHTQNEEMAKELAAEMLTKYPKCGEVHIDPLALNISCHIGPGCIALACCKKVTELIND